MASDMLNNCDIGIAEILTGVPTSRTRKWYSAFPMPYADANVWVIPSSSAASHSIKESKNEIAICNNFLMSLSKLPYPKLCISFCKKICIWNTMLHQIIC
jgi:hypothetical protein